ncbi:protein FAM57A [Diaphorina citri]|uniref:Protein FAM57A n=1 Tax=Diaphorina citri TaxID=121845 RepID=A0A1S3CVZ4_DIACI|nr:protein FAM57A [Diaphorina citri]XP_017298323.1 protein FAM57A [Diaphorina citri]
MSDQTSCEHDERSTGFERSTEDIKHDQSSKQTDHCLTKYCHNMFKILKGSITMTGGIAFTAMALAVQVIPSTQRIRASHTQIANLTILGLTFYTSMFHLLLLIKFKTTAGKRLAKKFQLKKYEVYDICVKSVSALQAFLACLFACLVVMEDRCNMKNNFIAYSRWIDFYTWFGLPYFFYDIVVMYKAYTMEHGYMDVQTFILRNKIIFLHHLFIPTVGLLGVMTLRRKFGDCVFMFLYTMEFSTIFVNIRLILHRLRMTSSVLYFANGIAMLVSFFICRIVLLPYMFYAYIKLFDLSVLDAIKNIPLVCHFTIALFMILQVYWLGLMLRVTARLLRQHLTR